ncbi:hypothetical protein NT07LI_0078, partial [Listeria innocua FSL S4-378]
MVTLSKISKKRVDILNLSGYSMLESAINKRFNLV